MLGVVNSKPLDGFPLLRSCDIEEVRHALARVYARSVMVPARSADGLNATMNVCHLHEIGLGYGTYGAVVEFDFPETGLFCLLVPIRGRGEFACGGNSTVLTADTGAVISADVPHRTTLGADYEHLVLRINARTLTDKLAAMTGAAINEPLRMDSRQDWRHPAARMLQQYLPLLTNTLSKAAPPLPDWWIAQTEQLVMTLFLCGHRHNYSHLLEQAPQDAAPAEVRRAEEYLEANMRRNVSLEELAEVTAVSVFSLFSAFKKHRGYSPLEFVARLRSRGGCLQ